MKKTISGILAITFLIAFVSCTHKSQNGNSGMPGGGASYIIIGHPGGNIFLPHLTYYLIENNQLTKDTTVPWSPIPTDISGFHFNTPCTAAQYALVQMLPSNIPAELLNENGHSVGQGIPDIGYTDVRVSINGTVYKWQFQASQSSSSAAVQQFVKQAQLVFQ